MDAAREISLDWLRAAGAPTAVQEAVIAEVALRLASLPSLLNTGTTAMCRALAVLPPGARRRALELPGFSELRRLVDSLTAVSYFDALGRGPHVPAPRRPLDEPANLPA
jgi:hypothetical protein